MSTKKDFIINTYKKSFGGTFTIYADLHLHERVAQEHPAIVSHGHPYPDGGVRYTMDPRYVFEEVHRELTQQFEAAVLREKIEHAAKGDPAYVGHDFILTCIKIHHTQEN